jgi:hypothetical protein
MLTDRDLDPVRMEERFERILNYDKLRLNLP